MVIFQNKTRINRSNRGERRQIDYRYIDHRWNKTRINRSNRGKQDRQIDRLQIYRSQMEQNKDDYIEKIQKNGEKKRKINNEE